MMKLFAMLMIIVFLMPFAMHLENASIRAHDLQIAKPTKITGVDPSCRDFYTMKGCTGFPSNNAICETTEYLYDSKGIAGSVTRTWKPTTSGVCRIKDMPSRSSPPW